MDQDIYFPGEPTQAEAFEHEIDARMAQAIDETWRMLGQEPLTLDELKELITEYYGATFPHDAVRIWFLDYWGQCIRAEWMLDKYEFVANLALNDI